MTRENRWISSPWLNYPRIRPWDCRKLPLSEDQSRSRLHVQERGKSCRYRSTSRLLLYVVLQYAWYISALFIAGRKGARRRRRCDAGGGPGHPRRAQQNIYQLVLGVSIYGAIWQGKSWRGSDVCSAPVRDLVLTWQKFKRHSQISCAQATQHQCAVALVQC